MNRALIIAALVAAPKVTFALEAIPDLPMPVTNNAVAAVDTPAGRQFYTFGGLLEGKTWRDTTARAWTLPPGAEAWVELPPVPEGEGRLASVAVTVAGRVYVFGGYTVAEDGDEASLPYVHSIAPGEAGYRRHADMPVPVDDTVAIPFADRYIYLVSGWHDLGNVNLVQLYDTVTDTWTQARPWPGPPVFGHAGGIVGDTLVICDGVKVLPTDDEGPRRFVMSDYCATGEIDAEEPRRMSWTRIEPHPGDPLYRSAGGANDRFVWLIGGSTTAYNFDGIGYDGTPAEPAAVAHTYNPADGTWDRIDCGPRSARMDHRGSLMLLDPLHLDHPQVVGGMGPGREVSVSVDVGCTPAERHE